MMSFRIVVWLIVFWVGFAWGQVYKWTDHRGSVHFTDNPSHVPPEYRSGVEVERASPSAPPLAPTDVTAPSEPPSPPPPRDRLGRGPDYWQQLAERWSTRLQQHIYERDRLQMMYRYTQNLANSTRNVFDRGRLQADRARLEQAIAEVEAQIKEAETMLRTTLPLEARRLGANPDWLKPPAATPQ